MRRKAGFIAVVAMAGSLMPLSASAKHEATARYLTPATNGVFINRNVPNPQGALSDAGPLGLGGYNFPADPARPKSVRFADDVTGTSGLAYTICSPDCDGVRIEGCTDGNGVVGLGVGWKANQILVVYVHAFDPAFRGCENTATTGTITVKYK